MAKVGKYELVRKLATGGMAEVFLAKFEWARGLEKTVVVKRILQHLADDPGFIDMFFTEAQLAAQLNHPNIAQIIEFGESEGISYLAMEHVDGPSLRALLAAIAARGDRMPFAHCAWIVACACEALAYAHELRDPETDEPLQLVHRDVSPDNILISKNGAVKLVDFGIAKAATQEHRTKTGLVKGKLSYMSPEQLRAESLDRRSDIFSLGVVLYELIAGAKLYETKNEIALIHSILYEDVVPLSKHRPDVPPELVSIVTRALERDRELRYADCRTMHGELESFSVTLSQRANAFQLAELVQRYTGREAASGEPSPARDANAAEPTIPARTRARRSGERMPPAATDAIEVKAPKTDYGRENPDAHRATDAGRMASGERPAPGLAQAAAPAEPPADAARVSSGQLQIIPSGGKSSASSRARHIIGAVAGLAMVAAAVALLVRREEIPPMVIDAGVAAASPSPEQIRQEMRRQEAQKFLDKGREALKGRDHRLAEIAWLGCLEFDEENAECHLELGRLNSGLRNAEKATHHYQEFLRLMPDDRRAKEIQQALADLNKPRAAPAVAKAPVPAPTNGGVNDRQIKGKGKPAQNEPDAGVTAVSTTAKPATKGADAGTEADQYFETAKAMFRRKEHRQARIVLERCVELDRNHAECHLWLGFILGQMGQVEKRAEHYRAYLRLAPNHEQAATVRHILGDHEGKEGAVPASKP